MNLYYIETAKEKNHPNLVHVAECKQLPNFLSRKFLGHFNTCKEALSEAKKIIPMATSCKNCLFECKEN